MPQPRTTSSRYERLELLQALQAEVIACERCPRLIGHCRQVAAEKRRAYQDWTYWGKPVPSFGDPSAKLLIVGLAPGAHGANRTGRMFTGDSSGEFLYRALYEAGFASQADAVSRDDGLRLHGAYITAPVRCAPPQNKPLAEEIARCRGFFDREFDLLPHVRVILALGRIAFDAVLDRLRREGRIERRAKFAFAHGRCHIVPGGPPAVLCSYHPSKQNTQTGRLTPAMFRQVVNKAKALLENP